MSSRDSKRSRLQYVVRYAVIVPSLTMLLSSLAFGEDRWYRERPRASFGWARSATGTASSPIPVAASHAIIYDKGGVPLDVETLTFCDVASGEQCTIDKEKMLPEASRRRLNSDWLKSWCGKSGARMPKAVANNFGSWSPDDAGYLSLISRLSESTSLPTARIPKDSWSVLYFSRSGDEAIAVECLVAAGGTHLERETFTLLEGKKSVSPGTPAPCTTPPYLCSYFYKNVEYCRRC